MHPWNRRTTMRHRNRGLVLLTGLLFLTSLVTLTAIGLARSMTELRASRLFITNQQAFQLAEAGVDQALAEFVVGGTDGTMGSFSIGSEATGQDGWADASSDPECQAGMTCRARTFSLSTGAATVTVLDTASAQPTIKSQGTAGQNTRRVRVIASLQAGFPPILGVVTVVEDDSEFFELHQNQAWLISGHDSCGSEPSIPAITTTTDHVLDTEVYPDALQVPSQVVGATGDFTTGVVSWQQDELSIHSAEHNPNVLTPEQIVEFVNQACSNPDFYYEDGDPEDTNTSVDSPVLRLKGGVNGLPTTWGTVDDPKITCLNNPNGGEHVFISDIAGAGILLVNSNLTLKKNVTFQGLVVVYGDDAELDFERGGTIEGAVIVAATGGSPLRTEFEMGAEDNESDLIKNEMRSLLYCSDNIEAAVQSFQAHGGSATGAPMIRLWQAE